MKTMDFKGKAYVEVSERIKHFRSSKEYDGWSLESEIVSIEQGVCIIKAVIKDSFEVVKANGIAYEVEGTSFINKTSYIENCETSAWGRALGNLGIGIDGGIASLEEVQDRVVEPMVTPEQIISLNKIRDSIKDNSKKEFIIKILKPEYKLTEKNAAIALEKFGVK